MIDRDRLAALKIERGPDSRRGARGLTISVVAVFVVLVAFAAAWLAWPRGVAVRVAMVAERRTGDRATVLNASGYVVARRRATVASKITGKLVEVRVEEGRSVEAGEILARLDANQLRAVLALAEAGLAASRSAMEETSARLALAELSRGRADRLATEGVIDQSALDEARAEVAALAARAAAERDSTRVAEREVALRRAELDDSVITAPFSGVVISKDAQPGEIVSPVSAGGGFTRTGICTIVDMSSLEIEVEVNESYIRRVEAGQAIEARLDAYPDQGFPGSVITTIPAADRQKATVLVRIAFDALDPRILPDMGVKVAFRASDEGGVVARVASIVPKSALRRDGNRDVVFVVAGDRVERRAVTPGDTIGEDLEVRAGLTGGERVVIEGPSDLADGDAITVVEPR